MVQRQRGGAGARGEPRRIGGEGVRAQQVLAQPLVAVADACEQRRERALEHRLVHQQVATRRPVGERLHRRGVAGEHHVRAAAAERQREGVHERWMDVAHRLHPKPLLVDDGAGIEGTDRDQGDEFRTPFVMLTQLDVGAHRLDEAGPVGVESARTEDGNRGRESGGPGGVQERPQLEVVVRVQVRDEDRRQLAQRQTLLDQPACDAETAVDDDSPPVEHEQARRRHGRARSDGRSALGAEQHDLVPDGAVHRRGAGSAADEARRRARTRCARERFMSRIIGDTVQGWIGVAVTSVAQWREGACPATVKRA